MEYEKIRQMLRDHGISNVEDFTERQLGSFWAMTRGAENDPDMLAKKIKDWRKTLYRSARR